MLVPGVGLGGEGGEVAVGDELFGATLLQAFGDPFVEGRRPCGGGEAARRAAPQATPRIGQGRGAVAAAQEPDGARRRKGFG